MKKKKTILMFCVTLIVIIIASISLALFTSRRQETAKVKIGDIQVDLIEDWDKEDVSEIGIKKYTKKVYGKNVKEKDAYVRIRVIPVVQYLYEETPENGEAISEWRTIALPQENIKITITNDEKWSRQGEYYYYNEILKSGESTSEINIKWDIYELPSEYAKYENVRCDVKVLLEYSQVTNDKWKEIFQIEDLPAKVQRLEVD